MEKRYVENVTGKKISVHICSRDRWTELALILQSLRTQTVQDFDIVILDDASGMPITQCHFLNCMINRIKLENHKIELIRNDISYGVCAARNKLIEEDIFDNKYIMRVDDDVILENNFIERLLNVINQGYDIASGITPPIFSPEIKREIKYVKPIINRISFDGEGNIIDYKDDCGFGYIEKEILPTHQFRSNALYKSDIGIKYENNLSPVGFREEAFFSLRAVWSDKKIGVDTGAVAYHLLTPSGGCRNANYSNMVKSDDIYFRKWAKEMYKEKGDLNG